MRREAELTFQTVTVQQMSGDATHVSVAACLVQNMVEEQTSRRNHGEGTERGSHRTPVQQVELAKRTHTEKTQLWTGYINCFSRNAANLLSIYF